MSIYQKLQTVRCEVNKKCNKKSGHNKYAGFDYFQLEDFLPTANEEFLKVGLCPVFTFRRETYITNENFVDKGERAILTIYSEDGEKIIFETPLAEVKMGSKEEEKQNPIQKLGATHTYLKRYLYMNALELSEGDVIDATIGKEEKPQKMATPKQIDLIKSLYAEEELKTLNIDLEQLTLEVASNLIKAKK